MIICHFLSSSDFESEVVGTSIQNEIERKSEVEGDIRVCKCVRERAPCLHALGIIYRQRQFTSTPLVGVGFTCHILRALVGPLLGGLGPLVGRDGRLERSK